MFTVRARDTNGRRTAWECKTLREAQDATALIFIFGDFAEAHIEDENGTILEKFEDKR